MHHKSPEYERTDKLVFVQKVRTYELELSDASTPLSTSVTSIFCKKCARNVLSHKVVIWHNLSLIGVIWGISKEIRSPAPEDFLE